MRKENEKATPRAWVSVPLFSQVPLAALSALVTLRVPTQATAGRGVPDDARDPRSVCEKALSGVIGHPHTDSQDAAEAKPRKGSV